MSKFFISYSRVDLSFVQDLYKRLQQMRPRDVIWFDKAHDGLLGGDSWWDEILDNIADSDIFIYVLSNESVQSAYCRAEFQEARRLQKRIITIQARDRTKLTDELRDIQYVDMKNGVDDIDAITSLSGAMDRQIAQVKRKRALWRPRTPKPSDEQPITRVNMDTDIDTPTLVAPRPIDGEGDASSNIPFVPILIGVVIVVAVLGVIGLMSSNGNNAVTQTPASQDVAQVGGDLNSTPTNTDDVEPTNEPTVTDEPTESPSPENSPTPTNTPNIAQEAETLVAEITAQQFIANTTATSAQTTLEAGQTLTQEAQETATATVWTKTPTPDYTASVESLLTQWYQGTATEQSIVDATATATLWTATPTQSPVELAQIPVTVNDDWTIYEQEFDGVTMVLVPAGCFMMGSADGDSDERPVHKQCIEDPFWIDKYEVTNAQYGSIGCESQSSEATQPRNCVDWLEAKAHCEARGGQLPTEKEWEIVARGPDNVVYPWGNTYIADNVIGEDDPTYGDKITAPVGSRPEGASWVGAMDMSGNVWEWTSSLNLDYPYDAEHKNLEDENSTRVLRGGSFLSAIYDLRVANRSIRNPLNVHLYIGFRCVRDG